MIPLDAKLAGVTLFGEVEEEDGDDRPAYENVGRLQIEFSSMMELSHM